MSFEMDYHPQHLQTAQTIFAALNHHAQTTQGQYLLAQCNINGFVVRGSALAAFAGRTPIFERAINDVDFRTYSADPNYRIEQIPRLLKFINDAVRGTDYTITMKTRDKGRTISERARSYIYPRIEMTVASKTNPEMKTEFHLSLYGAHPDPDMIKPTTGDEVQGPPQFVMPQSPLVQLLEKIRIINATSRVNQSADLDERKTRRALDLLDIYQAYHVALADEGSDEKVVAGLKRIFGASLLSQFNMRTKLSIAQHVLVNHLLFADTKHFDEQHDMKSFLGELVERMTQKGMLKVYQPIDPDKVMATAYQMADLMPLPISRTLVRLRRPQWVKRIKKLAGPSGDKPA